LNRSCQDLREKEEGFPKNWGFKTSRLLWNHGSAGDRGGEAPSHSPHADVACCAQCYGTVLNASTIEALEQCSSLSVEGLILVNTEGTPKKLAIIGAGGIGSNLAELLIPALIRLQMAIQLTFMDDDKVEGKNVGHQRYFEQDIGKKKVDALVSRFSERCGYIESSKERNDSITPLDKRELDMNERKKLKHYFDLIAYTRLDDVVREDSFRNLLMSKISLSARAENLRTSKQLEEFDMIIVCVDRPEPRRLVHESGKQWIDLRCTGDGWLVLTSDSNPALVTKMTPDHEPKSCQIEGALECGNLEFGFVVAAAFGAQWVIQALRGQQPPVQSMGSLTYGAFNFPTVSEVSA